MEMMAAMAATGTVTGDSGDDVKDGDGQRRRWRRR